MTQTMNRATAKPYERAVERFAKRLKLAHFRIAESVDNVSHDMKFITILDLSDKSIYYLDMRDTEQTDSVKLGRLTLENGAVKLIQHSTMHYADFDTALTESVIEPMRTQEDNSKILEYIIINDYENFKSFVKDTLGLLPCRYGKHNRNNGVVTTKYSLFSVAYQN